LHPGVATEAIRTQAKLVSADRLQASLARSECCLGKSQASNLRSGERIVVAFSVSISISHLHVQEVL
jgi:hypothetical protein